MITRKTIINTRNEKTTFPTIDGNQVKHCLNISGTEITEPIKIIMSLTVEINISKNCDKASQILTKKSPIADNKINHQTVHKAE